MRQVVECCQTIGCSPKEWKLKKHRKRVGTAVYFSFNGKHMNTQRILLREPKHLFNRLCLSVGLSVTHSLYPAHVVANLALCPLFRRRGWFRRFDVDVNKETSWCQRIARSRQKSNMPIALQNCIKDLFITDIDRYSIKRLLLHFGHICKFVWVWCHPTFTIGHWGPTDRLSYTPLK